MPRCIIAPQQNGGISVTPVGQAGITDEHQLAQLVVDEGVPYRIIDRSELPTDMKYRDAWRADFSEPDGYGLSPKSYAETYQK